MGICYATSKDGISWVKPNLGLVEYEGSKKNNIIWRGPHGTGIFKDLVESDPDHRYKAIFEYNRHLSYSFSGDGIVWNTSQTCEGVDVAGDTHNNGFWAPTLGKYVAMTRTWRKTENGKEREVARIESNDYEAWTKHEVVLRGTELNLQTYAMPVFFYGGVYLGLVAIHQLDSDRVWTELTWSPDTKVWHRISEGTPLIPCSDKILDYDYGCVYACATPVFLENEIRLYYGGSDYLHYGWRNGSLCLAILRPDGFAGYEQEKADAPAVVITQTLPYSGQTIRVSADVEEGGSVNVSILDNQRQLILDAGTLSATGTDIELDPDKNIREKHIRLRFEIRQAKVYSFSYGE